MKHPFLIVFLLTVTILFAAQYSCNTKTAATTDNPCYAPETEQRISRIISSLQVETPVDAQFSSDSLYNRMRYYHTPGVSVAVINDGKLEWARGFTSMLSVPTTRFQLKNKVEFFKHHPFSYTNFSPFISGCFPDKAYFDIFS